MYNKIAKSYNELHKEEQLKKLELIKRHVNFEGLVLDIGAGTGISSEYWRNAKVISLEPAFEMLKQSKCEKVQAKAEELPFKDEIFDGIISLTALHHADLKEALTVLLNLEFKDILLAYDEGYGMHKELRDFISEEWKRKQDFNSLIDRCIEYLKKNGK